MSLRFTDNVYARTTSTLSPIFSAIGLDAALGIFVHGYLSARKSRICADDLVAHATQLCKDYGVNTDITWIREGKSLYLTLDLIAGTIQ